jgi:AraC family transcriptional regulator, regulatory protein of adaptative response / DNA-3-methyladenine glycosylase II
VGGAYARVVSAPAGPAVATVSLAGDTLMCDLNLSQPSDREHAIGQVRRRFDLDADPLVVADVLSRDEALSRLVAVRPGLRWPGALDGFEVAKSPYAQ